MEEEEKGTRKTTFDEQVRYNAPKLSTSIKYYNQLFFDGLSNDLFNVSYTAG